MKNKVRILPKDIPEFKLIYSNTKLLLLIFEVDNTTYTMYDQYNIKVKSGLIATRNIINKTYRKRINPWCNVSNEINRESKNYGKLTLFAIWCWEWYSFFPILLAFQNNKLIAERIIPYDIAFQNKNLINSLISKKIKLWWNINNLPFFGIPINMYGFNIEYNPDENIFLRKINKYTI